MTHFSSDYENNVAYMDKTLRVEESFDIIKRCLTIGGDTMTLYYIDGFIKDGVMQRLMQHFLTLKGLGRGKDAVQTFLETQIPYVEADIVNTPETARLMVLSGAAVLLGSSFEDKAIVVDARTYPARTTEEPENDRVMQGARDGFVETLIFNTALIRRRIRDPRLTMSYLNLGGASGTDVVVCYMEGLADTNYVKRLKEALRSVRPKSLTLGTQSLAECLIRRRWWNPFPKFRTTERPDTAAAQLMEGSVLILCDTSPQVMLLPTSLLDFLQETNDYYYPPVTGTYLRLLRLFVFMGSFFLAPTWYLLVEKIDLLPPWLGFVVPDTHGDLPLIVQIFLAEFAIDALKLASMNTPNLLSNSLSVIGGLILGDFAVTIGWLSPDVIFYMAVVSIASFAQQNQELSYAVKFLRMITLLLTHFFGPWGYLGGILLSVLLVVTNCSVNGKNRYLSPLVPPKPKSLFRLLIRVPKDDFEN